jgi:hypothetical protein
MLHFILAGLALISPQEDELTPAQTLELLQEAHRLMGKAEELLNDSSRGRRLLETIEKLVGKAEKSEKDAADKLGEILRKARSTARQDWPSQSVKQPLPGRAKAVDEPSKFQSPATKSGSWGHLPPDVRRAMLAASREEVPPEFLEAWKKYVESFSGR